MNRLYYLLSVACSFAIMPLFASDNGAIINNQSGEYSLQTKDAILKIKPSRGGRISSFQFQGKELLYVDTINNNWGSTLWPSPQSVWSWPPPLALDFNPYTTQVIDNKLVAQSTIDTVTHLQFTKILSYNASDSSFVILYIIENKDINSQKAAPWEVTRVPAHGFVFFDKGEGNVWGNLAFKTKTIDKTIWYNNDITEVSDSKNKFFCDGKGWLASVYNNVIFIKTFEDLSPKAPAKGESEIEIYTSNLYNYSELENQGAQILLQPNEKLQWQVKWYVRQLPQTIKPEIGNAQLVDYVKSVITKKN